MHDLLEKFIETIHDVSKDCTKFWKDCDCIVLKKLLETNDKFYNNSWSTKGLEIFYQDWKKAFLLTLLGSKYDDVSDK